MAKAKILRKKSYHQCRSQRNHKKLGIFNLQDVYKAPILLVQIYASEKGKEGKHMGLYNIKRLVY